MLEKGGGEMRSVRDGEREFFQFLEVQNTGPLFDNVLIAVDEYSSRETTDLVVHDDLAAVIGSPVGAEHVVDVQPVHEGLAIFD